MSPFNRPLVLDNDVVSRLYSAGALARVLGIWPKGTFCITGQVLQEASRWPGRGQHLIALLTQMNVDGTICVVTLDESSGEEISMYANLLLGRRLGLGESASIAIACHRGYDIATDDGLAREACKAVNSSIAVFGTGDLLKLAVRDGLITQGESNSINATIRRLAND